MDVTAILETSAEIGEIAKVLPVAQAAMGEVFKTANNPAFKSKYADLASVIEAVVPALNKHGIALLQPTSFDGEAVRVGTVLMHTSGQWVRSTISIPLAKRDAQGIGSASTYGKRYGLMGMSGVAPEDDDGNAASRPGPTHAQPVQQAPAAQTLAERSDALAARLKAAKDGADLGRAWALGSKLCGELDAKDPDRLAELTKLHDDLMAQHETRKAA